MRETKFDNAITNMALERVARIERSKCDICAVNETGLTGAEYMEVSDFFIHGLLQIESGLNGGLVVQVSSFKRVFDVRK